MAQTPTLPFSRDEMKRILAACDDYPGNHERMRAFVLAMRYTGLRIGDTIRLSKSHVVDGRVFVHTAKTGQPVTVPVPAIVTKSLSDIENGSDRYFWTGKNIRSAVSNWSRYLARVFELAKIDDGHSHRFRDTCAVELLLAGASVEDVAMILGNTPQVVSQALRSVGQGTSRSIGKVRATELGLRMSGVVLSHPAVDALRHRLGNSQRSIRASTWPVLEEHDDSWLVEEQPAHEVIAHAPELGQLVNGVVPFERSLLDAHSAGAP